MEHVQNELRREIREKMRQRFDIVEIPRNITINDFCLAAVINLVRLSKLVNWFKQYFIHSTLKIL